MVFQQLHPGCGRFMQRLLMVFVREAAASNAHNNRRVHSESTL